MEAATVFSQHGNIKSYVEELPALCWEITRKVGVEPGQGGVWEVM